MQLLTKEFLDKYPDSPEHMSELSQFVFYRTYSRFLDEEGRRETFKEAIARAVEYNVSISVQQFEKNQIKAPIDKIKMEAEILFDNIFNLRQFLSGRTHWVGGASTGVANKFPLANFNCSFLEINEWSDLAELFYLLLVGTGVGFSCSKEMAQNLQPIRRDYTLLHSEYKPVRPEERLQETKLLVMDNGYAKIYVADSKEGWVTSLEMFFQLITEQRYKDIKHIKISYNSVRPNGERLKTFGGTASGHEPLRAMFEGIDKVFKDQLDPTIEPMNLVYGSFDKYHVRPIHILDIGNLIGNNVVVGGVRRTSEIFLCDPDDMEVILAKYGINGIRDWDKHVEIGQRLYDVGVLPDWWSDASKVDDRKFMTHRYMSNNSIAFREKPTKEMLDVIFLLMRETGEPGFVNMEEAGRRRPNAKGVNPCGEILLDNKQVCNLTTINMMGFIKEKEGIYLLDYPALMEAQALSVRAGMRMTCIDLELDDWNMKHKRDRLIGASVTGWKDAIDRLGFNEDQEASLMNMLSDQAHNEAVRYAYALRIPVPLLVTTVKPEGTLSQVANGVSSGVHVSHAPYYIRRIRINSNDPLRKVAELLNWKVDSINDTLSVISFPMKSPVQKTRAEQTLQEQFDTYFRFQENYTTHNSSNTITVRDDEWGEASKTVYDKWDNFVGVTFIPYDGGTYEHMPYEEIDEEKYTELKSQMLRFDVKLLHSIESYETEKDVENMQECDSGICPIF